jgi:lipopolysaccharide cholinephosphotransferase
MQELQEKMKRLQTEFDYEDSSLVVDHDDGLKGVMPKEILGTPTFVEFEGRQFCGVEQAHTYLSKKYGEYMVIPDGEHQRQHNFNYLNLEQAYREYK